MHTTETVRLNVFGRTAKVHRRVLRRGLITDAKPPYAEQHRLRDRKDIILLSFRISALIAASIVYGVTGVSWIAAVILTASVPLPWLAVLIANKRPPKHA
ncbi:DUF3099 domain-containing protein [Nocardia sp. NPDC052316]|uniref:DUF3099 domain-containing protein n=1 Tax=Nocardia sp. NPDC052316 TaxID=3364329 RepID=UPI0037C6BB48